MSRLAIRDDPLGPYGVQLVGIKGIGPGLLGEGIHWFVARLLLLHADKGERTNSQAQSMKLRDKPRTAFPAYLGEPRGTRVVGRGGAAARARDSHFVRGVAEGDVDEVVYFDVFWGINDIVAVLG